jgi:tetratricopeptide (TPR) repeat protein
VAFSPDGARLASASQDQTVKVWDAATGQELCTLKGHTESVHGVAFSPDGARLASASRDGTVAVYDARPLTPELKVELEALGLVETLVSQNLLQGDVLAALQRQPAITEPVRAAALAFAKQRPDNPNNLNERSWSIVRVSGAAAGRYRQALRAAQAACHLQPANGYYLTTLGVAQYRAGQYQDALATLMQAEPLNAERGIPADLAFQAMALFQLGQKDKAAATLARLHERMKAPRWVSDAESLLFLEEAEALIEGRAERGKKPDAKP